METNTRHGIIQATCKISQHRKDDAKQLQSSRKLQGKLKREQLLYKVQLLCSTLAYMSPRHMNVSFMPSSQPSTGALGSVSLHS